MISNLNSPIYGTIPKKKPYSYLSLKISKNQEIAITENRANHDSLIAKNLQKEQYIAIIILFIGIIAIIGFFSRRFEYALIFALTLTTVLIVFLLAV